MNIQNQNDQGKGCDFTKREKNKFSDVIEMDEVGWKFWKRRRYIITILIFFGFFISFILRVSLAVAIVAMTSSSHGAKAEFDWDSKLQGFILSSFFYGNVCTQLLGGWLSARIGGKKVFGVGLAITAALTFITPPLTRISVYILIALRIAEGIFEAVTPPSINSMFANWAPPSERSKLITFALSGCTFGTVFAMSVCGILAQRLGWPSVFYTCGGLGLIWFIFWCVIVSDKPEDDPHISQPELNYIKNSLGHNNQQKLQEVSHPWKSIFKSPAVWAILSAYFSESWGSHTMVTIMPKFMSDVSNLKLENTGFFSAVPYLVVSIVAILCGHIADYLISRNILSTTNVRKTFTCSSFLCQAILTILAWFSSTPTSAIIYLSAAIAAGGISWTGYLVNPLDIAPQHASIISGIGNTISTLPGIISPTLTGYIVINGTAGEWRVVFIIAGVVYLIGVIVYGLCASGDLQKWAREKKIDESKAYSNPALDLTSVN